MHVSDAGEDTKDVQMKVISDSLFATHPRFGQVRYRRVERQTLLLGSSVRIASIHSRVAQLPYSPWLRQSYSAI